MPTLNSQFLFDVESRMRIVADSEYQRLSSKLWWTKVAGKSPSSGGKRERLIWLLDSAKIEYVDRLGGGVQFDDILTQTLEYEYKAATGGLELNRFQLEDSDGGGVEAAKAWAKQITAYGAYWPQKQTAALIKNGQTAGFTAYDQQVFFSNAHPNNPYDDSAGTYSNLHTAGSGAGAVPIHGSGGGSVTLDVAFNNLQAVFTYLASLKMPNGEDPRMLTQAFILGPPALRPRLLQLTNAKTIAQAATGGGYGTGDVEAIISDWGIGQPIIADELGAAFGGSDTDYYVGVSMVGQSEVGALNYGEREPFGIVYNGEMTDAQLARANKLQWLVRGRNVGSYGHPFLLHKCRAT